MNPRGTCGCEHTFVTWVSAKQKPELSRLMLDSVLCGELDFVVGQIQKLGCRYDNACKSLQESKLEDKLNFVKKKN